MDMIQQWAYLEPRKLALVSPNHTYTWQQLDQVVNSITFQLVEQNVQRGSIVAMIAKNEPLAVALYLACLRIGALCALMPPQSVKAVQQKLDIIQADFCWLGDAANDLSGSILCPEISFDANIERTGPVIDASSDQQWVYGYRFDGEQQASIVFTSGSTGIPKAVVHCVKHHIASAEGLTQCFEFNRNDSWLLSLPIYHVSGLSIIWRWLNKGATVKIGQGNLLEDLYQVTHASLVPVQLLGLLEQANQLSLKRVLLGGGHIPQLLTEKATKEGIECWVGYGMTETASTVIAKQVDGSATSGSLLPLRQMKVENDRVYVAGETLAQGYLSEGTLTPLVTEISPWFDTKDLAKVHHFSEQPDEFEILGRADNLFISGGENIHCEEIEGALTRHSNIKQAVVIPIEDEKYGQRPVVFIDETSPLDPQTYQEFLLQFIDKFKCPDAYYPLPSHLMNSGIKISRSELKRYYAQIHN